MPHLRSTAAQQRHPLQFPPVAKDHILNCSYDAWFPQYRSCCIRSRIIPLPPTVISYLQEDGIILANDGEDGQASTESADEQWTASGSMATGREADHGDSSSEDESEAESPLPPNERFPETHRLIEEKIQELGGSVAPKLNWSAPKDAKWISPHQNTMKCQTANDVYLLLKSSSFVSHDLSHAFNGCSESPPSRPLAPVLVLRSFFSPHTALEFRCFVKHRALIGITQRDLNFYDFLEGMRLHIRRRISEFFIERLKFTFIDANFTFDIYIPEDPSARDGLGKVRLIDINPWAPRTDTLLFSWDELLAMEVGHPLYGPPPSELGDISSEGYSTEDTDIDAPSSEKENVVPELRLIEHNDPAAFNFSSPQYSAHKLPQEVVEASMAGLGGLRDFAQRWRDITEGQSVSDWHPAQTSSSTM